jgi:hypothetical protein
VKYHYWLVAHALEMLATGAAITGIREGSQFWFCGIREVVEITGEAAQVLAEFIDYQPLQRRSPAIVVNPYGDGQAIYMAAGLGEAYTKMEMPYLRQMVRGLMGWLGIEPVVVVEGVTEEAAQDLEVMVLEREDGEERTVVIINHSEETVEATLRISIVPRERMQVRELIRFESLACDLQDDRMVVRAVLPGRDVTVLNIYHLD